MKNHNKKFIYLISPTKIKNRSFYNSLNLVFRSNDAIVNLAGIIGSSSTMCNSDTKTVLVECAYFCPEIIIGKSVKYDIKSDAAHKFERSVDPLCHEYVLRRFIKIVSALSLE